MTKPIPIKRDVLIENGLPSSPDIERVVIASALNFNGETWETISAQLNEQDFTLEKHRRIWRCIAQLSIRGESVDYITVSEGLKAAGHLESIGGLGGLMELEADTPRVVNIAGYCKVLREKSTSRRLILAGQELIQAAAGGALGASAIADWAERVAAEGKAAEGEIIWRRPGEIVMGDVEAFYNPPTRSRNGVWLPWKSLRGVIPSLNPGKLILVAARPSVGKSSAAFQIGYETAKRGLPVAAFSLETPGQDIIGRITCGSARVDSSRWQRGLLEEHEMQQFRMKSVEIGDLPLFINDSSTATVPGILSAIERLPVKPRLVIIDYLQLMSAPGENRTQEVSRISRDLKKAALRMEVPFLVLSQLSRDSAKAGRPPELSDLRESGSLEQDADDVIFLHPAKSDDDEAIIDVKFIVRKQRNGPKGSKTLQFHRAFTWFEDTE